MRRREIIAGLAGAAGWSFAVRGQQGASSKQAARAVSSPASYPAVADSARVPGRRGAHAGFAGRRALTGPRKSGLPALRSQRADLGQARGRRQWRGLR
jgi:hypothetical protein